MQDVSLSIRPHEVIALLGLSAGSASALIEVLAGRSRPSSGQVFLTGEDLYKNLKFSRANIGYVPRAELVHPDLTVAEALNYAAGLRLPKGMGSRDRRARVQEVVASLDLAGLENSPVKSLDPEPRKRVSIGVELLAGPRVLFLDEPYAGLDPAAEARLAAALRKLAEAGLAVVLATQSIKSALQADRVSVLLPGGYQGWFGPPAEAVTFFNSNRSPADRNGRWSSPAEVFDSIGSAGESEAQEWAQRYRAHPAYKKYLAENSKEKDAAMMLEDRPLARRGKKDIVVKADQKPARVSGLRQFQTLTARSLKLLARDPLALLPVLAAPWLGAGLVLLSGGRAMYDLTTGSSERIIFSLALLSSLVLLFAGLPWAREIQRESGLIRQERQSFLKFLPYIFSKAWVVVLAALYQAVVWTGLHYLLTGSPLGAASLPGYFVTLLLVAVIGGLLGLLVSALTPTRASASLLLLGIAVLHLFLSGGLRQVPSLSRPGAASNWLNPARLDLEAMVTAGGHGVDIANDLCLRLDPSDREAEAFKGNCACWGIRLFESCRVPGVQGFYVPELGQSSPEGLSSSPPALPPVPVPTPGAAPEVFQDEVNSFGRKLESSWLALNSYFSRTADWELKRRVAIENAQKMIMGEWESFGQGFNVNLPGHWAALGITASVLLFLFAGVEKRKEVRA